VSIKTKKKDVRYENSKSKKRKGRKVSGTGRRGLGHPSIHNLLKLGVNPGKVGGGGASKDQEGCSIKERGCGGGGGGGGV